MVYKRVSTEVVVSVWIISNNPPYLSKGYILLLFHQKMDQKNCFKAAGVIASLAFAGLLIVWIVWDPMSNEGRGLVSTSSSSSPPCEDTAIHQAFIQNLGKPLASTSLWFRYFIKENPHLYGNGSVLPDSILFPNSTSSRLDPVSMDDMEIPTEGNTTTTLKRSKRFFPLFLIPSLYPIVKHQLDLQASTSAPVEPPKAEKGLKLIAPALLVGLGR